MYPVTFKRERIPTFSSEVRVRYYLILWIKNILILFAHERIRETIRAKANFNIDVVVTRYMYDN